MDVWGGVGVCGYAGGLFFVEAYSGAAYEEALLGGVEVVGDEVWFEDYVAVDFDDVVGGALRDGFVEYGASVEAGVFLPGVDDGYGGCGGEGVDEVGGVGS